jgi:hypothetical protein
VVDPSVEMCISITYIHIYSVIVTGRHKQKKNVECKNSEKKRK